MRNLNLKRTGIERATTETPRALAEGAGKGKATGRYPGQFLRRGVP